MDDKLPTILIIVCTFGLCGIFLFSLGIALIISNRKFARNALVADGVVVALETSSSDKGRMLYSPVVEFVDKEDRKIRFVSSIYESECSYEEGEHVEVRYDQDFEKMELADTLGKLTIPLASIFLGSMFLVITLGTTLTIIL